MEDSEAWHDTVHGSQRVRHNLASEQHNDKLYINDTLYIHRQLLIIIFTHREHTL